MWIKNSLHFPKKPGLYTCLVDIDGFGNLGQTENNLFDGQDWSHTESHRQFIEYWLCSVDEYTTLSNITEEDMKNYYEQTYKVKKHESDF